MAPPSISPQAPAFLSTVGARRGKVYMIAARTFLERGYAATSVNDIAAALRMTKAGLYHYIASKDALFLDILNLGMDWLDEEVVQPTRRIADPEARLREILLRHARLTTGHEPWITLLLDEIHALPAPLRRRIERRKRAYVHYVRGTLDALKRAGRLRDLDTTVAAYNVLAMIVWLPRWVRPGGRLSSDAIARETAAFAQTALLRPRLRSR
jgi:AcrR family transcriptional regulator